MRAKGYCYDNACVERFFHSLKVECLYKEHFISREIMRATVFNYIECDYNRWRLVVSVRNNLKTRTSLRPVSILRGWDQSQEMSFPKRWIGIQRGELKF